MMKMIMLALVAVASAICDDEIEFADMLGLRTDDICDRMVASQYLPAVTDTTKAYAELFKLMDACENHYQKVARDYPNDVLVRDADVGGLDANTRKRCLFAIYMYTVDDPHPKIFAMMNAYGREPNAAGGNNAAHGDFGPYTYYAGILQSAIELLREAGSKTAAGKTTYRGINLNLTCQDCLRPNGMRGVGCDNCHKGCTRFDMKQHFEKYYAQNGFVSSSLSEQQAKNFALGISNPNAGSQYVMVEFQNSYQGVPIRRYSAKPDEEEVLFHARSKHIIEDVAIYDLNFADCKALLFRLKDGNIAEVTTPYTESHPLLSSVVELKRGDKVSVLKLNAEADIAEVKTVHGIILSMSVSTFQSCFRQELLQSAKGLSMPDDKVEAFQIISDEHFAQK